MPLFPRLRLIAALLLAVLQVARVGGEWLDATHVSSAGAQPVVVHVEEPGGSGHCPPVHDLDCAICAGLATPALPSCTTVQPVSVVARAGAAPTAVAPLAGTTVGRPYDSRAPPVA